jgi:hypothetical protein
LAQSSDIDQAKYLEKRALIASRTGGELGKATASRRPGPLK